MKVVDSPRRQVVMAVLLGLAAVGAAIRHWSPNPSLARDIGTLMLVLWLPAVGNLVAFAVRKLHPLLRRKRGFADDSPFKAQLSAEVAARETAGDGALGPGQRNCTVIVGNEGFTARTGQALSQALAAPPSPAVVELEFLRPALALPRLPPGADFYLMVGPAVVASGRVRAHAGP